MLPVIPRGVISRLPSKQKPSLTDLIPVSVLALLQKLFHEATGVQFILVDFEGRWFSGSSEPTFGCTNLIQGGKQDKADCLRQLIEDANGNRQNKEPAITECRFGYKTVTLPIILRNMNIGMLHCGPFSNGGGQFDAFSSGVPSVLPQSTKYLLESSQHIKGLISTLAEQAFEKEENTQRIAQAYEHLHRIQEALSESERKYRSLGENSLMGIFIIQAGVFKFVNSRLKSLLDCTWEDLQEIDPFTIFHEDYRAIIKKKIRSESVDEGPGSGCEVKMVKKRGQVFWCELRTASIDYQGKPAIMGNVIDITERKKAEEALKKSQENYLTLVNHFPMGVTLVNKELEVIMTNAAQAHLFGQDADFFKGKNYYQAFFNQENPDQNNPGLKALATGTWAEKEMEMAIGGKRRTLRFQAFPVLDRKGEAVGFTELVEDRTDKKEAERKIAILSQAINGAKEAIVVSDLTGRVIYTNRSTSQMFGYEKDEMFNEHVRILRAHSVAGPVNNDIVPHVRNEGAWSGELLGKRKNGEVFPIHLSSSLVRDEQGTATAIFGIVEDLTERRRLERELMEAEKRYSELKKQLKKDDEGVCLIGKNPKVIEIKELIRDIADTDVAVLIQGETGTGKELVASMLHQESSRKNKPFIRVNCGALSDTLLESELFGHEKGAFTGAVCQKKGKFELANGGSIFLDEIGDISPRMQSAILRVIEHGEIQRVGGEKTLLLNVRIIAATNRNLVDAVCEGCFRSDLYYRLNGISITLPSLRERRDDLPLLIHHFLEVYQNKYNKKIGSIPPEIFDALIKQPWIGNVRELKNTIERIVVTAKGDKIENGLFNHFQATRNHSYKDNGDNGLDISSLTKVSLKEAMELVEHEIVKSVFEEENHDIGNAIKRLQISRSGFYEKLKKI